jgi:hemerythrin-like domain-containing protein
LINNFVLELKTHFAEEEENLYKPLKLRLGSDSPTDRMESEHKSTYHSFQTVLPIMIECDTDQSQIGVFQTRIGTLQKLLGEHIQKEEKSSFGWPT